MKRKIMISYGMNTCPKQMAIRCPQARALGAARLPHHALVFRGVADIVPMEGSDVHGALWSITSNCEKALDRLEGYPYLYIKKTVTVALPAGGTCKAMVYAMARHASPERLMIAPPGRFYHQMLTEGYSHFGLPLSQIEDAVEAAERVYMGEWDWGMQA